MGVNPDIDTKQSEANIRNITYSVLRFNPDKDKKPYMQTFPIPAPKGMTVLEGLFYIKENLDASLVWRSSCRMGICGSCGMFINGFPRLACHTQIDELKSNEIQIKPMPNYDILKDLIPDLKPLIDKHKYVHPYLIRKEKKDIEELKGEFFQTEQELENYIQFSFCIKCGLCMAACPTLATDDDYLGPQPMGQLFRYNTDTRDEGSQVRFDLIDTPGGPWKCHFAGACSDVCPKGVDPAFAIQLLKKDMLLHKLKIKRKKKGAAILPPVKDGKRLPDIPDAPEKSV